MNSNDLMKTEELMFRWLNSQAGRFQFLDVFMATMSSPTTWVVLALAIFCLASLRRHQLVMSTLISAIVALGVSDIISFYVVKQIVARERPCRFLENVTLILDHCGGSYGFTSNHAANAFAVWAIIMLSFGLRSPMSIFSLWLATLVAISRVYLGVHFWGDVLGGALLGSVVGLGLFRLNLFQMSAHLAKKWLYCLPSFGK